jgi:hypothetical protein
MAFDFYDRSDRFDNASLENCGIYFKRSFHAGDLESLPVEWQRKVVPFGLNYACHSARGKAYLSRKEIGESAERYRDTLLFSDYEQEPHTSVFPSIVFQTRAWSPESTSDDAEDLNEGRAKVIRELRKAFPTRFEGGFVPTAYANERYPELISTYPHEESQYVNFSKRHLIGISTHGLHQSVPFKVPEYMAASIAIVSEPFRSELPAPFADGDDFLGFRTPEECVMQCDRILTDSALANGLREASWRYYVSEVRPVRHIANLLRRALGTEWTS